MSLVILYFRAIDIQGLIGNIGGYIGLCLGYSILQIPQFIVLILCKVKVYISKLKDKINTDPKISFMLEHKILGDLQPNDESIVQPKYIHSTIALMSTDIDKIHRKLNTLEQRFETLETNLRESREHFS